MANQIAAYLNNIRKPGQTYWEPFCGACWVTERIIDAPKYASDANGALVAMWQAVQAGWIPPENVSEAEYAEAMAGKYDPALTAFIGFGCSFGGKWFAGYARGGNGRNYDTIAKNSLLKMAPHLRDVTFYHADFFTSEPPAAECLIYCDPPYDNTTGYGATGAFDTAAFWARCRWLDAQGHTVIVSEYQAPADFTCVAEMYTKTNMHTKNGKSPRVERLFRLGDHPQFQGTLF